MSQLHRTLFSVLDHSSAHVVAAAHCVLSLNRARQRRDGGGSQQSGQTISASTSATLIGWSWQRTGARVCGESRPWRASQVTTSLERTSVQPLPGQASHDLRTCLAYFLNFGKNGEVGSERELREAGAPPSLPGARAYVSLRSGLATAQPTNQPPNEPNQSVRTAHGTQPPQQENQPKNQPQNRSFSNEDRTRTAVTETELKTNTSGRAMRWSMERARELIAHMTRLPAQLLSCLPKSKRGGRQE